MKTINLFICSSITFLFLNLIPCGVDAGIILTQGQSFELEFNSMTINPLQAGDTPSASASFSADADLFDGIDSVVFSLFEDDASQPPLLSEIFNINNDLVVAYNTSSLIATPLPWQDRQGVLRIEVIHGSIELNSFFTTTFNEGQCYQQFQAIPEPNSVALVLLGIGVFLLRRNRINGNEPTADQ